MNIQHFLAPTLLALLLVPSAAADGPRDVELGVETLDEVIEMLLDCIGGPPKDHLAGGVYVSLVGDIGVGIDPDQSSGGDGSENPLGATIDPFRCPQGDDS